MPFLCREYYFLDTENSRYFKLFSGLSLRSKPVSVWFRRKERPINGIFGFGRAVSFLVPSLRNQMEKLATQAIISFKHKYTKEGPRSTSCNWLLKQPIGKRNFRSIISHRIDKCVWSSLSLSERLYCSRHKNKTKLKVKFWQLSQ